MESILLFCVVTLFLVVVWHAFQTIDVWGRVDAGLAAQVARYDKRDRATSPHPGARFDFGFGHHVKEAK